MSGTLTWTGYSDSNLQGNNYTDGTNNGLAPSSTSDLAFDQTTNPGTVVSQGTVASISVTALNPANMLTFAGIGQGSTTTLHSVILTSASVTVASNETLNVDSQLASLNYFAGIDVVAANGAPAMLTIDGNVTNTGGLSQLIVDGFSSTAAVVNVNGVSGGVVQLESGFIGEAGMASLNLANGANVRFDTLRVATGNSSVATVAINGSQLSIGTGLTVGGYGAGSAGGTGTLTLASGASLAGGEADVNAGSQIDVGANSTVQVTTLDVAGGTLSTHDGGMATANTLELDAGASLSVGVGTTVSATAFQVAGNVLGGAGATPTLAAASLSQAGTVAVTTNALALTNIAFNSQSFHLDAGTALSATNSTLSIAGNATIANGALTLGTGASFASQGLNIGSGSFVLNGANATLSSLTNAGTIAINSGAMLTTTSYAQSGGGSVTINGGQLSVTSAAALSGISFGSTAGGVLSESGASGNSAIGNFLIGDSVDIAGGFTATVNDNTVTLSNGATFTFGLAANAGLLTNIVNNNGNASLVITAGAVAAPPASTNPGTPSASSNPPASQNPSAPAPGGSATETLYRFFDTQNGMHFYTASVSEEQSILKSRPDLVLEASSSLTAANPASDPNAQAVYRFFDLHDGSYFFTTSAAEKNALIDPSSPKYRTDLAFESSSTFYEHTTQQAGDTAVYRYFDTNNGSHLYTDSSSERATISATRPDLVAEGVAFYEPAKAAS